jgi:hypothetical protein
LILQNKVTVCVAPAAMISTALFLPGKRLDPRTERQFVRDGAIGAT